MDPLSIIIFIWLFLLSAFFSSSETAFMSVPSHKINTFVKQKKFWAKELKNLKSNTDRLLITILLWNNLINTFTASFATSIAMDIAKNLWSTQDVAIGLSTWIVTLLLLLFGEIFPKTLATRYADSISLKIAKIYAGMQILFFPIIRPVEKIMKLLQRKKESEKITDEEIEAFIDLGKDSWALEEEECENLKNMLDFGEKTCEEIMTPRIKIDALPTNITVDEAIEKVLSFSHSRILVYTTDIDHIERVVTLKELYQTQRRWNGKKKLSELSLAPILKVALTQPIHLLLDQFKKMRKHVAIIIDEFGGVAWLVSLEDVIEEVFWDIKDETDTEIDPIRNDGNDSYLIQPMVRIEELLDLFELSFDMVGLDANEWEGETLSYFMISYFERIPVKGDVIELPITNDDKGADQRNLTLRIISVKNNQIGDIKAMIK